MKKNYIKNSLSSGALLLTAPALAQYSPTPQFTGHIGKTTAETKTVNVNYNPHAKPGAPNVVWILLDDIGFGASVIGDVVIAVGVSH